MGEYIDVVLYDMLDKAVEEYERTGQISILNAAVGDAAITLDSYRGETYPKAHSGASERLQDCNLLIFHIRNAFAHGMRQPRWNIKYDEKRKVYLIGDLKLDLTEKHGKSVDVIKDDLVGALRYLRAYYEQNKT
ncbi:MAG: hypothetical protein ABJE63_04605 [Lentilitoribacter sp.]